MQSQKESIARVADYYAARAPEYHETTGYGVERVDKGYAQLKELYQKAFRGHDVLEIACGTGYWTEAVAQVARSVLATDIHPELVEMTRQRLISLDNVRCRVADAYSLETVTERFSAAFAQYWWSHIPRAMRKPFLQTLHAKLLPGALVMFTDNIEYQGASVKRRVDECGDIYEERLLRDGSRFETIKNFVNKSEFVDLLAGVVEDLEYIEHDTGNSAHEPSRLWTLSYRLKGSPPAA
jgi:demethylmenaquinone methyltransferase/2-methoxy-6-polyprenyl-1,4-benzoquinol methylase